MSDWYGTVNAGNIDEVASRLKALLTGKLFTTVHCYEYRRWVPEVRLHQRLEGGLGGQDIVVVHHPEHLNYDTDRLMGIRGRPHAQFIICDTYGVGGFSTTRMEPGYDPEFNSPYIVFERNQVTVTDRAPNGLLYYAVWAVEGDIPRPEEG